MTSSESISDSSSNEPNKKLMKFTKSSRNIFSISGHNGAALVEPALLSLGWIKNNEKGSEDFRLRWTELVTQINYTKFREGEQMVNHIPNCGLITNKLGLLMSLRTYERSIKDTKRNSTLDMMDFVPETFIIDDVKERERFFSVYKDGEIWINKPTGLNQGKGISLIRDIDDFKKELDDRDNVSRSTLSGVKARIVQRYISNPLLLDSRKFDIRSYLYIASTTPYLVLYCPGYIRLSMNRYSNDDTDLITHLTNQFIQKKSPNYHEVKDDTVWSMTKFNDYLNDHFSHLPNYKHNWSKVVLEKQMQQIMLYVFQAVKTKLASRVGFFEIYGFDFMVDMDLKVWLIEVNVNPALHINCELLKEILPPMIEEVILLAIECFEKITIHKKQLVPLECQKLFSVIYWESTTACRNRIAAYSSLRTWIPPRYRSSSHSPNRSRNEETPTISASNSNNQTGNYTRNSISTSQARSNSIANSNANTSASVSMGNNQSNTSKGFRFESSLRSYPKINNNNSTNLNGASENKSNITQVNNYNIRSKSFNPVTMDKLKQNNENNSKSTTESYVNDNNSNNNTTIKQAYKKKKSETPRFDRMASNINFQSLTIDKNSMTTQDNTKNKPTNTSNISSNNNNATQNLTTHRKSVSQSVKASPAQREPAPISLVQVVTGGGNRKSSTNPQNDHTTNNNINNNNTAANTTANSNPTQISTTQSATSSANIQQFIANSPYKPNAKVKLSQVSVKQNSKIYDRSS